MHRSTPGNQPTVAELCRMTDALFHVLRAAFDVDTADPVRFERPENLSAGPPTDDRSLAIIGMYCAQMLHTVGDEPAGIDHDEAVVLLGVVDVVLRRLLRDRDDDSRLITALRVIHLDVTSIGFLKAFTEALDGSGPDIG
jgi:hypothetical protein